MKTVTSVANCLVMEPSRGSVHWLIRFNPHDGTTALTWTMTFVVLNSFCSSVISSHIDITWSSSIVLTVGLFVNAVNAPDASVPDIVKAHPFKTWSYTCWMVPLLDLAIAAHLFAGDSPLSLKVINIRRCIRSRNGSTKVDRLIRFLTDHGMSSVPSARSDSNDDGSQDIWKKYSWS